MKTPRYLILELRTSRLPLILNFGISWGSLDLCLKRIISVLSILSEILFAASHLQRSLRLVLTVLRREIKLLLK